MRSHAVFRPTVVIGLGGTGHGAVLKLKRRFIDAYGTVPSVIRFLSVDTVENLYHGETANDGSEVKLEPQECYIMSVVNPSALVGGANEHINEWWPANVPVSAIVAGAGQVRARGRLALFANGRGVFTAIRKAIDDVVMIRGSRHALMESFQVSERGGVEVYVVSSLSGGTGGGTFLDVAFIARSFLDTQSNITGVFVLPGVFRSLPGTSLVKPNTYAALKELESFSSVSMTNSLNIDYGLHQLVATQPPYDLIYLTDDVNEDGNVLRSPRDLLNAVADGIYIQINSQAGTDAANVADNLKAQLAVTGRVRGRKATYCSFGVASLTAPLREYAAMELQSARELIRDGMLGGDFPDRAMEEDIELFVRDSNLISDKAHGVLETLVERQGGGRLRFPLRLHEMKFDRTAAAVITQLHSEHRERVGREATRQVAENYTRLLERSTHTIDQWWEQTINRAKGIVYAPRFAEKLLARLDSYRYTLMEMAEEAAKRARGIDFIGAEERVQEASGALLNVKGKVRAACGNYAELVDRESDLSVEVIGLKKAIEFYEALCSHLKSLLHSSHRITYNLHESLSSFEQLDAEMAADPGGESPFEQAVQFDAGTRRPAIEPEDFVQWHLHKHGSLLSWANHSADEVRDTIKEYVRECFRPLTDLSVEDLLRLGSPESAAQDLVQVSRKAAPLWNYDEGKIPLARRDVMSEYYVYGVADANNTILMQSSILNKVPYGETGPAFVSTGDTRRITLLRIKTGVPLFALRDMFEMERAYKDPDKTVSNHLHREWETLPDVIPRAADVDALRWFAIAQAPEPFDLITRRGDWYYVRSRLATESEHGELRLGQGRTNAYRAFEMNRDLIKEVEEKIETVLQARREDVVETLRKYAERLQGQLGGGLPDPTKEQVESELNSISSFLQSL